MIAAATPAYVPYLVAAGVAFALYRRVRGSFGRQPWRPTRTRVRVVLLALVLLAVVAATLLDPMRNWGVGLGLAAGAALGLLAIRLIRIDTSGPLPYYVPNPWIGVVLTALLVGRLAWRFGSGGFTTPQSSSPLTLAIAATVIAFYLVQGIGLVRRMKRLVPAASTTVA